MRQAPAGIGISLLSHFDYKHPQLGYNWQVAAVELCVTKIKMKKYGTTK